MFSWTLIRKDDLAIYKRAFQVQSRVLQCHRWFSGWKDLDLIWEYVLKGKCQVETAREDYASARGTNRYGLPLNTDSPLKADK